MLPVCPGNLIFSSLLRAADKKLSLPHPCDLPRTPFICSYSTLCSPRSQEFWQASPSLERRACVSRSLCALFPLGSPWRVAPRNACPSWTLSTAGNIDIFSLTYRLLKSPPDTSLLPNASHWQNYRIFWALNLSLSWFVPLRLLKFGAVWQSQSAFLEPFLSPVALRCWQRAAPPGRLPHLSCREGPWSLLC